MSHRRGHRPGEDRPPAAADSRAAVGSRPRRSVAAARSATDWAFGRHAVLALWQRAPERLLELRLSRERGNDPLVAELAREAQSQGIHVEWHPAVQIDKLALQHELHGPHQGMAARFRPLPALTEADLPELIEHAGADLLLLALDQVTDPHNLGACLRVADGAGATAVLVPRGRSATLTPAARKVASGAAESVPLVEVANLARALDAIKTLGVWIYGLAGEADTELYDHPLAGPLCLVLGSEGEGLRALTRERCDTLVRLPMAGLVESLNVGTAAAVALYEARRQRGVRIAAPAPHR